MKQTQLRRPAHRHRTRGKTRRGDSSAKEAPGSCCASRVNGGGCSGFQYAFDIETARTDDDLAIESDGAMVLIDPVSLDFLKGARIDFVDDLIGQSFKIDNPNATASCGCGTSFSVRGWRMPSPMRERVDSAIAPSRVRGLQPIQLQAESPHPSAPLTASPPGRRRRLTWK